MLEPGQRRTGGERRERPQPALVVGEEQVVAPGQCRGERAAPLGAAPGGVGEEREPVVEPPPDLGHAEHPRAGGGQLDREREAVERAAERQDVRAGARGPVGARREQGDGVVVGQRSQREGQLALDAERPLAGGEHPHARRGVEHVGHRIADGVDQVLAVVQHEQEIGGPQSGDAGVPGQGLGERGGQLVGGPHALQPGQPRAVGRLPSPRGLDGEAGLAHPGGPDDRDEAVPVERRRPRPARRPGRPARCRRGQVAARRAAERRVVDEHLVREPGQRRPGVDAQLSASIRVTRRCAASASAGRPARYSAVTSNAHSPSRNGCSATSASSSPTSSPAAPARAAPARPRSAAAGSRSAAPGAAPPSRRRPRRAAPRCRRAAGPPGRRWPRRRGRRRRAGPRPRRRAGWRPARRRRRRRARSPRTRPERRPGRPAPGAVARP